MRFRIFPLLTASRFTSSTPSGSTPSGRDPCSLAVRGYEIDLVIFVYVLKVMDNKELTVFDT